LSNSGVANLRAIVDRGYGSMRNGALWRDPPNSAMRIRVGDYRFLNKIHERRLLILVVDIGHRSNAYSRV